MRIDRMTGARVISEMGPTLSERIGTKLIGLLVLEIRM